MDVQWRCLMHYHVKQQPQYHSNPIMCWSLGYSRGIPLPLFPTTYDVCFTWPRTKLVSSPL